jgi:phosphoribosylformylglycinamidine synthase
MVRRIRRFQKIPSPALALFRNMPAVRFRGRPGPTPGMKVKIVITPKKAVLDPQGQAVLRALEHMGHAGIQAVHVGRYLEIEADGERADVEKRIDEACHKLLSNPVIEDYRIEIEE